MSNLIFPLLAGHLIADFWFQPLKWVVHKRENGLRSGNQIAEYFLLGTLASFALAIFIGFGLKKILGV